MVQGLICRINMFFKKLRSIRKSSCIPIANKAKTENGADNFPSNSLTKGGITTLVILIEKATIKAINGGKVKIRLISFL